MNLISQIFLIILIACFTGTVSLGFWKLFRPLLLKLDPRLIYVTLRFVCMMYIVPFGYLIVRLTWLGYMRADGIWKPNFEMAGDMDLVFGIAGIIWLIFLIKNVADGVIEFIRWKRLCRYRIPVADEQVLAEFSKVKNMLHIHRKIGLYYSNSIQSPMVTGVFQYNILLPKDHYSKEELTVIFCHELVHCKHNDPLFKICSIYIGAMQHMTSGAKHILSWINEWSECACDASAVCALRDVTTPKRYFEVIVDLMERMPEDSKPDYIFSTLYESQQSLERRIEYMKKYVKARRGAKISAFALSFLFVVTSMTTTYAASYGVAGVHDELYQEAEGTQGELSETPELKEVFVPASENNDYSRIKYAKPDLSPVAPILSSGEMATFNWTVEPGTRYCSGKFKVTSGQKIALSASIAPGTQTCWIGIMDPHNNVRYVEGKSALSHTFSISETGKYRVFVQNRGTKNVTSSGSYYFQ